MLKRQSEIKGKKWVEESREGKRREGEERMRIASVWFAVCRQLSCQSSAWVSPAQPCAPGHHSLLTALSAPTLSLVALIPIPDWTQPLQGRSAMVWDRNAEDTAIGDLSVPVHRQSHQPGCSESRAAVLWSSPVSLLTLPVLLPHCTWKLMLISPSMNLFFCWDCFLLPYSFSLGLRKSPVLVS